MKIFIIILIGFSLLFGVSNEIFAVDTCTLQTIGECHVSGWLCNCIGPSDSQCFADSRSEYNRCGGNIGSGVIGNVIPPVAIKHWSLNFGSTIGLIRFFSLLIRLIAIIAGIFAMVNFVIAGLTYIASMGNTQANINVRDRLLFSFIGLMIIVSAYTLAAIIGLIFFGDATYILNPRLEGALN